VQGWTVKIELLEALEEMAKEEGIEREELYEIVKKGLIAAYEEEFGQAGQMDVEIDRNSGDIKIIADGKEHELNVEDFGRVAARKAEETIRSEIIKKRREKILARFLIKVGELISGSVHRFEGANVWLNLGGGVEALLPEAERIPSERYRLGSTLRAYLYRVEPGQGDPKIFVSRAQPEFVAALLKLEVPEVQQGLIKIEAIAREPGVRTKIAVRAHTPDIDPVGTCVGAGGSRIKLVVRELAGEKIDVIRWSPKIEEFIKNSLEPANVLKIDINGQTKEARVLVPDDQLSLAIGKGGQNVRLTAKLTGYNITVTSPQEESKHNA